MAIENFITYTEVDPNSHISVTASKVTFTGLARNEDAYVYKDFGVDFFAGDFEILLTMKISSSQSGVFITPWLLGNNIDDAYNVVNSLRLYHNMQFGTDPRITLQEWISGTPYTGGFYVFTLGTVYYLKIVRDESVGIYGTLYCYVYSNAARTVLLATLSLALHSNANFRYLYPINTSNDGFNFVATGYTENFDVDTTIPTFIPKVQITYMTPY